MATDCSWSQIVVIFYDTPIRLTLFHPEHVIYMHIWYTKSSFGKLNHHFVILPRKWTKRYRTDSHFRRLFSYCNVTAFVWDAIYGIGKKPHVRCVKLNTVIIDNGDGGAIFPKFSYRLCVHGQSPVYSPIETYLLQNAYIDWVVIGFDHWCILSCAEALSEPLMTYGKSNYQEWISMKLKFISGRSISKLASWKCLSIPSSLHVKWLCTHNTP